MDGDLGREGVASYTHCFNLLMFLCVLPAILEAIQGWLVWFCFTNKNVGESNVLGFRRGAESHCEFIIHPKNLVLIF